MDFKNHITDVPDYPVKGVIFKDITTLWKNPEALKQSINKLVEHYKDKKIDKIVAAEARGFIIGAPMALELNAGFVPIRKPKKLPRQAITETYDLEYGTDTLAMHKDAIEEGEKVLIVDDLIATGGTCRAIANLVKQLKGDIIGFCFLVELEFLKGREKIKEYDIFSLIKY